MLGVVLEFGFRGGMKSKNSLDPMKLKNNKGPKEEERNCIGTPVPEEEDV
jgi:hypothetical protein